jgi:hypothetical protein
MQTQNQLPGSKFLKFWLLSENFTASQYVEFSSFSQDEQQNSLLLPGTWNSRNLCFQMTFPLWNSRAWQYVEFSMFCQAANCVQNTILVRIPLPGRMLNFTAFGWQHVNRCKMQISACTVHSLEFHWSRQQSLSLKWKQSSSLQWVLWRNLPWWQDVQVRLSEGGDKNHSGFQSISSGPEVTEIWSSRRTGGTLLEVEVRPLRRQASLNDRQACLRPVSNWGEAASVGVPPPGRGWDGW